MSTDFIADITCQIVDLEYKKNSKSCKLIRKGNHEPIKYIYLLLLIKHKGNIFRFVQIKLSKISAGLILDGNLLMQSFYSRD